MIGLHTWLAREAERRARRPGLASALWLGRGAGYAWLRLWPLLVSLGLRSGLHAAELYLLTLAVPGEDLAPLFALRTGLSLASSAHWGALEPLRREVRALVSERQPMAASERVGRALGASLWLGALPLIACSARLAGELGAGRGLALDTAYAWACAVRLALELHARTFHAGVYACRRVYRPLWSSVAGDALSLALIVLGFRALGPFSVPLAIAASALLDAALTRRFARRAYCLARLPAPRARALRRSASPLWAATHAALPPALANLGLELDALLLLVLLDAEPPRAAGFSLSALLYVLRPWLGLASRWVRVFYFDIARLERGALRALRAHLRRYLQRVALACAACVAAGCVAYAWLLGPEPGRELLCLLALVLARAWLAPAQLEAFVHGRHRLLWGTALAFALALQLTAAWIPSAALIVSLAALLYALAALCSPAPLTAAEPSGALCSTSEWLARVARAQVGQLAVLRVAPGGKPASQVARALLDAESAWSASVLGRTCLLLSAAEAPALSLPRLVSAGAGLLEDAQVGLGGPPRVQLESWALRGSLPPELAPPFDPGTPPQTQLLADFAREFPGGRVLDLQHGVGHLRGLVSSVTELAELHVLLAAECAERKPTRPGRVPVSLALFAPRGRARWLFVCARGTPGFAAFHARVRQASWRMSLYGEPVSREARAAARAREARSLQRRLGAHDL